MTTGDTGRAISIGATGCTGGIALAELRRRHPKNGFADLCSPTIAAAREASARGADDALMLNIDGNAACSTIANLFVLKDGRLITPARDQAILTGVISSLNFTRTPCPVELKRIEKESKGTESPPPKAFITASLQTQSS